MRAINIILVHISLATSTSLFSEILLDSNVQDPIIPADFIEDIPVLPQRPFQELSNENVIAIHFPITVVEYPRQTYPISGNDIPLKINRTRPIDKADTPKQNNLESVLLHFSAFAIQPKLYGILGACVLLGLIISKKIRAKKLSH